MRFRALKGGRGRMKRNHTPIHPAVENSPFPLSPPAVYNLPMSIPRLPYLRLAALFTLFWMAAHFAVPPERTLGVVVRWVYAHASLTQVSLLLFLIAGLLALLYLLGGHGLWRWMQATGGMAVALWLVGFLLSTIPAKLSWGVWIDFSEPRTQMTLRMIAVAARIPPAHPLDRSRAASPPSPRSILSAVVLFLNRSTNIVRHPLNPIGQAGDPAIALSYGLIFLIALTCSAS